MKILLDFLFLFLFFSAIIQLISTVCPTTTFFQSTFIIRHNRESYPLTTYSPVHLILPIYTLYLVLVLLFLILTQQKVSYFLFAR